MVIPESMTVVVQVAVWFGVHDHLELWFDSNEKHAGMCEDESIDVCSSCPTRAVRVVYEPDYVGGGGSGQGRQLVGSPEATGR
uniref:Uncharacterized protein n=1 Tax=Oryza glaberrima TaxID=4538 RepID=I1R2X5_ORYGL